MSSDPFSTSPFLLPGAAIAGHTAAARPPRTLYSYIPASMERSLGGQGRTVSINAIQSEGLKPGVEGSVWATSMSPRDFHATLVGGRQGADLSLQGLKPFHKDFEGGYVAIIRDPQQFSLSSTLWKALLGQYESPTAVPPGKIEIVKFSDAVARE